MRSVSVIIPAYNQQRYLGEAIGSVLAQTWQDFEIIVVDDGSTDGTRSVAHSFSDPRIRTIHQENRGLSAARNTGIRHAQGRYLSYLDSDDLFLPNKLELLTEEMERAPALGFVSGQAILVNSEGEPLSRVFDSPLPAAPAQLLLGNPLHVGSVLVRREWQERAGFFDESLRSYEDWDMWLRLAQAQCPMRHVGQPVSLYRFHGAQMTRIGTQMTTATFAVLDKVFSYPALPQEWKDLKGEAYSRANLRAAAQAYLAADFEGGAEFLSRAVALDPSLAADDGALLARHFSAWIELPKAPDPLAFLESVYAHLPPELGALSAYRDRELAQAAMQVAYEAFERGDRAAAGRATRLALRHDPSWFGNRGAVSILVRSLLPSPVGTIRS